MKQDSSRNSIIPKPVGQLAQNVAPDGGPSPCSGLSEARLVGHAQVGCLACRNHLIERNTDRLRCFIVRMMSPSPDAEDIFQQTVYRALMKFEQFRADSSFLTWLCSIALNEARQLKRKQRRKLFVSFNEELLDKKFPAEEHRSALDLCCQAQQQTDIRGAVMRLQPDFRTVVELRVFEGLTLEETARSLRLTLSAAKSRYFRARKHLLRCRCLTSAGPGAPAC